MQIEQVFMHTFIYGLICLNNFIVRLLTIFIFDKTKRRKFRAKYTVLKKGFTSSPYIKNKISGKIFYPYYSKSAKFDNTNNPYKIYNKDGEPMKTFFIRGPIYAPIPPEASMSKYFIWDRFNCGLDVHFYTHEAVLEVIGNPKKKYAMFCEPETILPESYTVFKQNKGLEKDFDLIFTHHEEFLEKFDNARLFNPFARIWGALRDENGNLPDNISELKTKGISIISSNKIYCDLHKFRYELAFKCKKEGLADTFGTFDGGSFITFDKTVVPYKFSVAIENKVDSYWFTEKILNCFANMCIPIYLGATKIDTVFNPDGIIKITEKDFDNIDEILKKCTPEEYFSRLDAVKENYYKSLKYKSTSDLLYEKYLKDDLD